MLKKFSPCFNMGRGILQPFLRKAHQDSSSLLPQYADAIVIGGGSIGCSTLYHLTKYGIKNCILLERDKLTSGTTWHAAGLYWSLRPSDIDIEMLMYSKKLVTEILPQETEIDCGWINNGGLFIASTAERLDEYKRMHSLAAVYSIDAHLLSPAETKRLFPLINVDDVYGTLFSPGDGGIDPSSFCNALIKVSKNSGARIFEKCPVKKIVTKIDDFGIQKIDGILTQSDHFVKSPIVVNCAGAWAPKLFSPLGLNLPTMAMRHAYVTTEKIDEIRGLPNIRDHDAAVYTRVQGDALTFGGYESNPIYWQDVKDDFSFGLFDVDWDRFETHTKGACNRLPILKSIGIKSNICGPMSFTPDHKPLMGETDVRGLFVACGIELGIMMGGALGQQTALWAISGRPDKHLYGYDIRRFNPKLNGRYQWIKEKLHEAVYTMYKIHWPRDEPLAGRNQIKSPFHDALLQSGCIFQERHGWERPGWFSDDGQPSPVLPYDYYGAYGEDRTPKNQNYLYEHRLTNDYSWQFPMHHDLIKRECQNLTNGVALIDASSCGKVYLSGPEAEKAIDYLFASDITSKSTGESIYTCALNQNGGVEADLIVSILDSSQIASPCAPHFENDNRGFYLSVGASNQTHVWTHIRNVIADNRFSAKLINCTEEMGVLSVQGPRSKGFLSSLINVNLSDDALPKWRHCLVSIKGHKCRLFRLPFLGEIGYELHIPLESCVYVFQAVREHGRKFGLKNVGYRALESVLAENGYRSWDNDLRFTDTALETGLIDLCDKLDTEKNFLGREALEQQKQEGVKRRIACFTLDSQTPLWGLEAIYRNGEPVGFIRRAEYAFTISKPIGFGMLIRPDKEIITDEWIKSGYYEIATISKRCKAKVHLTSPLSKR